MTQPTSAPFPLTRPQDIADPYPIYRSYREEDPVHVVPATTPGGADTWYLFADHDVARILTSQDYGRSARTAMTGVAAPPDLVPARYGVLREVVGNWLVFLDPPRHTRLRLLIAKHFSPRVVRGLRSRIESIAAELLTAVRRQSCTDLVADYAAPLPILVISELLGVPPDQRVWMRDCAMALQEANSSRVGDRDEQYARAEAAARQLRDYFQDEVLRRRHRAQDDMMSTLVRDENGGEPLTDQEIIGTCVHLLTAGHETTTNLLSKATLALLGHPRALSELRAHPHLMVGAVDELIRYDCPVQMVSRWAYRDDVLGHRAIARGSRIMLVLGSANRDPQRFSDPDTLDLGRLVGRHWGFGGGIHYCLGAGLAHLEAEIGLTTLLCGLPDVSLGDEPVQYANDLVFHGPARLPLRTGAGADRLRRSAPPGPADNPPPAGDLPYANGCPRSAPPQPFPAEPPSRRNS
jgi:cytochrome P450